MTRTNTLLIKTPEGVVFSQTLAGPVTRFLAWLVDFACIWIVMIISQLLVSVFAVISPEAAMALLYLINFVITSGYGMLFEWFWRGQTPGKRVLQLRVTDANGLRLRFSQVAIRNLLRAIDSPVLPLDVGSGVTLPGFTFYPIGGVLTLLTRKAQRLGDLAAGTVVIRIPKIAEPNLEQLGADKFNSLRAYPHLCARLRQRVTPAEASTALQAVARRDEFEASARVTLFAELAEHFRSKVEFPSEAVGGIADEQYVRNVVDVLYRSERRSPNAQKPGERAPTDALVENR